MFGKVPKEELTPSKDCSSNNDTEPTEHERSGCRM